MKKATVSNHGLLVLIHNLNLYVLNLELCRRSGQRYLLCSQQAHLIMI
jgi:hypothetical protein